MLDIDDDEYLDAIFEEGYEAAYDSQEECPYDPCMEAEEAAVWWEGYEAALAGL